MTEMLRRRPEAAIVAAGCFGLLLGAWAVLAVAHLLILPEPVECAPCDRTPVEVQMPAFIPDGLPPEIPCVCYPDGVSDE